MYLKTNETTIDLKKPGIEDEIAELYNQGYIFGRIHEGYMSQTRSLRVRLSDFQPTSENRRILRKMSEGIEMEVYDLPLRKEDYHWSIHKLGYDFYNNKFDDIKFTANKIKELVTVKGNFNRLFAYSLHSENELEHSIGFCISHLGKGFLHYCYPFYDLDGDVNNLGMYMMLQAIIWGQMHGLDYVYLGGITRPKDRYKLQFKGVEWFDGSIWSQDLEKVKNLITS